MNGEMNLTIFGENSPVKLPEFFNKEVKEYEELLEYFPELTKEDIVLLERIRDWNGYIRVTDRMKFLDKYLDIPRVKRIKDMQIFSENSIVHSLGMHSYIDVMSYIHYSSIPSLLEKVRDWSGPIKLSSDEQELLKKLDKYLDIPRAKYVRIEWPYTFRFLIEDNQPDLLAYVLKKNKQNYDYVESIFIASEYGRLECLKVLCTEDVEWKIRWCEYSKSPCEIAAKRGYLECLRYLHSKGFTLSVNAGYSAILHGNLDCFRYVMRNLSNVSPFEKKQMFDHHVYIIEEKEKEREKEKRRSSGMYF